METFRIPVTVTESRVKIDGGDAVRSRYRDSEDNYANDRFHLILKRAILIYVEIKIKSDVDLQHRWAGWVGAVQKRRRGDKCPLSEATILLAIRLSVTANERIRLLRFSMQHRNM